MASHSKAPWSVDHDGVVWAAGGNKIAVVKQASDFYHGTAEERQVCEEECEANARLIAAAPDLLAALRHLHEIFGPRNTTVGGKGALMQARKVIEKVEGR